jgi:hypothetical protein
VAEEEPRPAGRISAELRPYVDRSDAEPIDEMGRLLEDARIAPRPRFRDALRSSLLDADEEPREAEARRPDHLWLSVFSCLLAGLALMAIAALGASGMGPLG